MKALKICELTAEALQVLGKLLLLLQPEFFHLGHLKGRREPSKHLLELLHHSSESVALELVKQVSPE